MNVPRQYSVVQGGDVQLNDDALPVDASLFSSGVPILGAGYTLLGMGSILDTTFNTGTSLLDLGACFSAQQNFAFNLNNTNCMITWKAAQYNRYGLQYFNYTPPVAPAVCNTKCSNVGRNTSIALVKYDTTSYNGVTKGFFTSVALLQIPSNVVAAINIDQQAASGSSQLLAGYCAFLLIAVIVWI